MVDIQTLPSSPSSCSSSSSSGDDSSSSSGSSASSLRSKQETSGQEMTTTNVGSTQRATTENPQSHVITSASSTNLSNETSAPVEMVVCVNHKSPSEAVVVGNDDNKETSVIPPLPPHQEEEDEFPYFQSDESLHVTPGKQEDDFFDNDLLDDDLAKLLDSPNVIAKQSSETKTFDSTDSSIDTDNLEIPHSATPPRAVDGMTEEVTSRFFSKSGANEVSRRSKSAAPKTATTTQRHDIIEVMTSDHDEEQACGPSTSTRQLQQQDEPPPVILEPRIERASKVDSSLYQPPPYRHRPDPIVHHLSIHNRPKNTRQSIPVKDFFASPLCNMWRSKFDAFNHLQSEVANTLAHSNDSIVVSAPTGAGKTALFEIAMGRFFSADLASNGQQVSKQRKIVYVAPSKALCEERYQDWTCRLSDMNIGIQCAMITGDSTEPGEAYREVEAAHVILTTPEKWDSLTRRWTENVFLFGSVKLLLLDEVHLLGDGTRGCCLESIVCRMKMIQRAAVAASQSYDAHAVSSYTHTSREALSSFLRMVGVSATLPNISSIAAFLEANEAYAFDASYRPVPLKTHVVGLGWAGKNAFMFGKSLNRHVPDLIKRFSRSKPTIVFCHTKKETETLAMELSKVPGIGLPNNGINMTLASQTKIAALQGSILRGIAYHHAGLDVSDRKLIETAFVNGKVVVLCATSTLAMGVNLPAHLVMIKGTSAWRGSGQGHQEIDAGTLLQMMGRAGRPGFDTSGTAVIMTDNASKQKYEKLSGGMEVVESHLPARLMDVMNTEISQRVITSFEVAQNWIKSTFFFRRAMENPVQYGLSLSKTEIEEFMDKSCLESLERLNEEGIITFDDSGKISPNAASHIMSQHMVDFESMKRIVGLPFDSDQGVLLKILAECDRLHRPVRRSEKKALNEVHKLIRFKLDGPPSKVRIQSPAEKAFVLLQAAIGQHCLEDFTLRQEMSYMVQYATRMLSAMEEYCIDGSRNGHVALQSLRLRRSLATSLWGPGDGVLNQLQGVGHLTTAKLRFSNILSFVDVLSSSSEEIERAAGRQAPFGKELRIAVSKILKNTLQLSACVESEGDALKFVVCSLTRRGALPGIENVESDKSAGIVNYTLVVFTDRPGGSLVFQPNISTCGEYRLPCPPTCGKIFVNLIASMVGLDEYLTLDGNDDVLESAITVTASDKKKRSRKKQTPAAISPKGDDVRMKRKPAGKRKATKQQALEPSYARAKKQHKTSSQSAVQQPAAGINQRRTASSQPRAPGTNTATAQNRVPSSAMFVTPSPLLPKSEPAGAFRAQPTRTYMETRAPVQLRNTGAERLRGNRNSNWLQGNRAQNSLQQNALCLQKEQNLFSSFAYNPNNMKSSLTGTKSISSHPRDDSSTLPLLKYSESKQASAKKATPSISLASGRKKGGRGQKGRRGSRSFPQMDDRELLKMKAREQEAYAVSINSASYHQPPRDRFLPQGNYPFDYQTYGAAYEQPVSGSIFSPGHYMRGDQRGFTEPVLYEPINNANVWNDGGRFVTQQSQKPAFSQHIGMDDFGNHPNYDLYAHLNPALDPVSSQQNRGHYYGPMPQPMPAQVFGATQTMQQQGFCVPQMMQPQGFRNQFMAGPSLASGPPMEARRVFEESGPNEEDELFDAAFPFP